MIDLRHESYKVTETDGDSGMDVEITKTKESVNRFLPLPTEPSDEADY